MSWLKDIEHLVYYTNNYCNLHCEKCSTSQKQFAVPRYDVKLQEVRAFMKNLGETKLHIRLEGGESTAMDLGHLENIIGTINNHGHKISLITNGYAVHKMNPNYLRVLDYVLLDDHNINQEAIARAQAFLKKNGISFKNRKMWRHYDLEEAARHKENQGHSCWRWLKVPAVWDGVLFPCCPLPLTTGNRLAQRLLKQEGWSVYNPRLLEAISKPQQLPARLLEVCHTKCWFPNLEHGSIHWITRKTYDDILKEDHVVI